MAGLSCIPKAFEALPDALKRTLTEILKLNGATYKVNAADFKILAADHAYATISSVRQDDESKGLEMFLTITFVNSKKDSCVKVLTNAVLKDGKVHYYLPVSPTDINDTLARIVENVTVIMYDENVKRDAILEGGNNMVTSFFKAMTDYSNAIQEAIAKFETSLQELGTIAENSNDEEILQQLETLKKDASEGFSTLFDLIGKLAEVYAKLSKKMMSGSQ